MTQVNVNIAYQRLDSDSFNFLSCQNLHPEFYFSGDAIDIISEQIISQFVNEVKERKFKPSVHAPFFNLNLGARDKKIRKISYDRMLWAIETASKLNANQVVIHPGYGPWILGHRLTLWLNRAEKKLTRLMDRADQLGIKLAFENIYDESPEDLLYFLNRFPNRNVGICFDVGHFNVFSKVPMEEWLQHIGDRIIECHLHDNDGTADQHIAIGDGKIDYSPLKKWLKEIKKHPTLTLELPHKTHVIKSLNHVQSWLAEIQEG